MPFGFLPRSRTSAAPTPATAAADDDAALLSRCADGDAEALARIYRRHGDAVYRYAWLVTGSESLAADVVQETFVALLDRPSGFDPARGRAAAYLCGIARHLAARQFDPRMESTASIEALAEQASDDGVPLPPQGGAERAQALARLYAAIRQLAPPFRDVLVLADLQELSYAEVAAITGIELGTVRSRLARARARLRELLPDERAIGSEGRAP
jgi:RNA polymerase sigma-70 factor (ECF subfamily)